MENVNDLPEDHPVRLHHEAAARANKKLDAVTAKRIEEYNEVLFRQEGELNDLSVDQAEYETGIYAKVKCEIEVVSIMDMTQRYQHPMLFRQLAEIFTHKADACETMEVERAKAVATMNEELSEGDKHG
jgi:hypothetical protein